MQQPLRQVQAQKSLMSRKKPRPLSNGSNGQNGQKLSFKRKALRVRESIEHWQGEYASVVPQETDKFSLAVDGEDPLYYAIMGFQRKFHPSTTALCFEDGMWGDECGQLVPAKHPQDSDSDSSGSRALDNHGINTDLNIALHYIYILHVVQNFNPNHNTCITHLDILQNRVLNVRQNGPQARVCCAARLGGNVRFCLQCSFWVMSSARYRACIQMLRKRN